MYQLGTLGPQFGKYSCFLLGQLLPQGSQSFRLKHSFAYVTCLVHLRDPNQFLCVILVSIFKGRNSSPKLITLLTHLTILQLSAEPQIILN